MVTKNLTTSGLSTKELLGDQESLPDGDEEEALLQKAIEMSLQQEENDEDDLLQKAIAMSLES